MDFTVKKEKLFIKVDKIHKILAAHKDAITEKSILKAYRKSGMTGVSRISQDINTIQENGRLLNIGVIGRVKAGKSSLLNSLFFEGDSVLPKAATPMTAALTTMTYGDTFKALVQLYNEKDIEDIHVKADEYREIEREIRSEIKKKEESRFANKIGSKDTNTAKKVEEKINKKVKLELREHMELEAAFLQSEELRKQGRPGGSKSDTIETSATNLNQLKNELGDFVTANGRYTPYTKSVDLYLPYDDLKDIRVIDTPGINDPIVSREQRTNELLMQCDVVFIVSPGGKFFDTKDQQLVSRLTKREGLQHIYFIASQIDNTLNAPEYSGQPLSQSLPSLTRELCRHLDGEIDKMMEGTDTKTVKALRDGQGSLVNRFALVSAMSEAIATKGLQKQSLESDEAHALENIQESFHIDYDKNPKSCLKSLSGIDSVKGFIEKSREAKDEIIAASQKKVIDQYIRITDEFQQELLSLIGDRQREIESADIQALENNRNSLQKIRQKIKKSLDGVYKDGVVALEYSLNCVGSIITQNTEKLLEEARGSTKSENQSRERSSWIFFTETYYENIDLLDSSVLSGRLGLASNKYSEALGPFFKDVIHLGDTAFKSKLIRELNSEFQNIYNQENIIGIDHSAVTSAIREIVNNIPINNFKGNIKLPDSLRPASKLSGGQAHSFSNEAINFLNELDGQYRVLSKEYIDEILISLPKSMTGSLFDELDEEISRAKSDIDNMNQRIFSLKECKGKLEAIL